MAEVSYHVPDQTEKVARQAKQRVMAVWNRMITNRGGLPAEPTAVFALVAQFETKVSAYKAGVDEQQGRKYAAELAGKVMGVPLNDPEGRMRGRHSS